MIKPYSRPEGPQPDVRYVRKALLKATADTQRAYRHATPFTVGR